MAAIEHEHLTQEMLERYLATAQNEEGSRMLLHLLAVCPECREAGGMILAAYRAGAIGTQFSPVDVDLFESRLKARDLWGTLKALPFADALRRIRRGGEYVTWGFAELLARESRDAGTKDASRAVDLATLAVEVAMRLTEGQPCEEEWLCQLRAFAHAHLVNAYRIACHLREAEKAQRKADEAVLRLRGLRPRLPRGSGYG